MSGWVIPNIVQCPNCQTYMVESATYCPKCGQPRSSERERLEGIAASRSVSYDEVLRETRGDWPSPLPASNRRAILDARVAMYTPHGYRVVQQTESSVQLVKPKEFSALAAIVSFLLFGIGLLVYVIYYAAQRDKTAYITVDEFGNVMAHQN